MEHELGSFAQTIFKRTYAFTENETWDDCAKRVSSVIAYDKKQEKDFYNIISKRKFIPGGRYLYAAGREIQQFQNCALFIAEDSREGWAKLLHDHVMSLSTGAGCGTYYGNIRAKGTPIKKYGGEASGPLSLMAMVNECARHVMSGGSRRCLPSGTLVHTSRGLIPIEDIFIGDEVLTFDGFRKVANKFNQGIQPTIEIVHELGILRCTPNHKVAVLLSAQGEYTWKEASQLTSSDLMMFIPQTIPGVRTELPGYTYSRPAKSTTCRDISIPKLDVDMAWFIGFLHGDGHVRRIWNKGSYSKGLVSFPIHNTQTTIEAKLFKQLEKFRVSWAVKQYTNYRKINVHSKQLAEYLTEYKQPNTSLSEPCFILEGEDDIRAGYLAGLFDADGSAKTRPLNCVTSVYRDYLRQVQALYASLGIVTMIKDRTYKSRKRHWKQIFCLSLKGQTPEKRWNLIILPHVCKIASLPAKQKRQCDYKIPYEWLEAKERNHKNSSCGISIEHVASLYGYKYVPSKVHGLRQSTSEYTWDLEVSDRNEFVAEGMLVHNSALWAGLPWNHPDIDNFIKSKNWPTIFKALKEFDFNNSAFLDMTNISVCLDDDFFKVVNEDKSVWNLYYNICKNMCKTGEPGFSINLGKKSKEVARNACLPSWSSILTPEGIRQLKDIKEGSIIWSGKNWSRVIKKWNTGYKPVYKFHTTTGTFIGTEDHKVVENGIKVKVKDAKGIDRISGPPTLIEDLDPQDIMDGLVIGDGGVHKASNNLILLYIGKNDQSYFNSEIAHLITKHRSGVSKEVWEVKTTIQPEELVKTYNRVIPDRFYYGNFNKIKGFLKGLFSANGNTLKKSGRICLKQSSKQLILQVRDMLSAVGIKSYITTHKTVTIKHHNGEYESKKNYDINITTDRELFFNTIGIIQPYKKLYTKSSRKEKVTFDIYSIESVGIHEVFDITVDDPDHTFWTGGVLVSNCTESVSDRNADVCNLGSVNLANINSVNELEEVTRIAVRFLYNGTFLSWVPVPEMEQVRKEYRRIGLGLMGLHEWCIKNNQKYEPSNNLKNWLTLWQQTSDNEAILYAKKRNNTEPIAIRAIAPTGTISICAQTTSGIEPIFCVAYKRRFLDKDSKWKFRYVVDPTAEKLIQQGFKPEDIEDAHSLSQDVERRIIMQEFVQKFVDQGISSTINLPEYGEPGNNNVKRFADILLKYLPNLRGITVYPEGSRAGAPLTPIRYDTAKRHENVTYEESEEKCLGGACGI